MNCPWFLPVRRRALSHLGLVLSLLSCGSATLKVDGGQGGRAGDADGGGAGTTLLGGHSGVAGGGGAAAAGGSVGQGGALAAGGRGGSLGMAGGSGAAGTGPTAGTGGGACSPGGSGSVAILGCPCTESGKLACNGNAQAVTLLCSQGAWSLNQTCSGQNLCDSRVGTCQPIDPLCQGAKLPGQKVCSDAASVAQCGPDRVSATPVQTCSGATPVCLDGACVACAPSSTQACGPCSDGAQTCGSNGTWGACMNGTAPKTYYRDSDHDQYGDPAMSTTVCGAAPSGYVTNAGDCCDRDANAHPGQTAFFSTPDACGSAQVPDGYDYNCDGKDTTEAEVKNASCVSTLTASGNCGCPMCYCNSMNGAAPVCGVTACVAYSVTACGTSYAESGRGFDSMTCSPGAGGGNAGLQGCN